MKVIFCIFAIELIFVVAAFGQENLGSQVNSPYDDFAPVISPDGNTLFFCREGHPENMGYSEGSAFKDQDIWYSVRQPDGSWSKAKNLSALNNRYPNSVGGVTPDGNAVLLLGSYSSGGITRSGFSFARKTLQGWSSPEPIIIEGFLNKGRLLNFFLCSDAQTILFSIESDISYGGRDIYVSFQTDSGSWSKPLNLGPAINSSEHENSPFLASDGKTLYFSAKRPGGMGNWDVYRSVRLDSSWQKWSEPENLGPEINGPGKDYHYILSADGKAAYYAKDSGDIGGRDIFRTELPDSLKPEPVIIVAGKVIDSETQKPLEAKITYQILPGGKKAGHTFSDPVSGEYKIILALKSKYASWAESDGFYPVSNTIDARDYDEYTELEQDIDMKPLVKDQIIRLNNIFFDFDKSELKAESYPEILRVVEMMSNISAMTIEIRGHTDSVGSFGYNMELSRKRAESVAKFIYDAGIAEDRVSFKGYGSTMPLKSNETEEGRRINRRVEFKILESGN